MQNDSMWKIPLVRELAVVLAIKLVVIFSIKSLYFSTPVTVNPDALFERTPAQTAELACTQPQATECNH